MHGGLKIYRGNPAAARHYLVADRSRADDYYLVEGSGFAEHYSATRGPSEAAVLHHGGHLDGSTYEQWVSGRELETGDPKGRLRTDAQGVRFVEIIVNGPKTWSLAAAQHSEIGEAYDAVQQRAAEEIIWWVAEHATSRVGSRGCQVQVPVTEIEAAVVRHYTSRAGDPHRHLHLQINARVLVGDHWRGLHTVGVRDSLDAINGIGHAAVMCDPEFRHVLAAHGYTLDPQSGEVEQLTPYAGAFSARTAQISRNVGRYEADWRSEHPGEEPGPSLRRAWDRRAWSDARPDKVIPRDGSDIAERWNHELEELGFRPPHGPVGLAGTPIGALDRNGLIDVVLTRLGSRRSAWNDADLRGEIEQQLACAGIIAAPGVRSELAEDLTARAVSQCVRLIDRPDVPAHIRFLTSAVVVSVEKHLTQCLTARGQLPLARNHDTNDLSRFEDAQQQVIRAISGFSALLVIEGAAGSGKTSTLGETRDHLNAQGRKLVVVTPTLKAAQVASSELDAPAYSAAALAHAYGFRWDDDGRWTRQTRTSSPDVGLRQLDVLLVDEAGMLDQDTAAALVSIANEAGACLVFLGDRHQLPAVGRGGVLDIAADCANPEARLTLDIVHRFTDPEYADLSLLMRTGENPEHVFDTLMARGEIRIHPTEVQRLQAVSREPGLLIAPSREQVAELNATARDHRRSSRDGDEIYTSQGEAIGVGDVITTRLNDADLDVANRERWTVTAATDADIEVEGHRGSRRLPFAYVMKNVELAYATTVHGAQGQTVEEAHLLLTESTGASAAYVGMTRGRHANTAHLVANTVEQARAQWTTTFTRDHADLGPSHARLVAWDGIDRYGLNQRPRQGSVLEAWSSPHTDSPAPSR